MYGGRPPSARDAYVPPNPTRLLPLRQQNLSLDRFPVPHHLNRDLVPWLLRLQRIREVVQILNRLAVELHHHIAALESRLRRRRPLANVRELHALHALPEIRNRSKIRTVPRRRAHRTLRAAM